MTSYLLRITGLVQGVGFRPFIFRLASDFGLKGWVNNTSENVQVCIHAEADTLEEFIRQIRMQAPPASQIESIDSEKIKAGPFTDFRIMESESLTETITEVSPDLAVCSDCLEDMKSQSNRLDYPFLNCTNCGPRFTIISDLPYDRQQTTMRGFTMCESCATEYGNVMDRRFHAQPTACRDCGPVYSLAGQETPEDVLPGRVAEIIDGGGIVTIKGLGGFFIACDAGNEDAVRSLRNSKHREGKPFAVMFRDIAAASDYCEISGTEKEQLESWRRPIVILRNKPGALNGIAGSGKQLAGSVSNGFPTTGVMLPYMPFHYLLFEKLNTPAMVLTSGNLTDEPILIDNGKAEEILGPVSGAVLHYNRDIYNRCDDSVVQAVNGSHRLLRRSRGYVPNPVRTNLNTEGIFAAGAELVNCFAIGKGKQVIMSQHIGDLKNFETFEFYTETYERFVRLFRLEPELAVHDMHPDYLSSRFAVDLGLPTVQVQHHHAHIASVLAEHKLDEKLIGVSFDGTGLGDDGNIWGSEFMVCDLEGYERKSHLEYLPMPGGDRSTYEPWRLAISYLYKLYGRDLTRLDLPFLVKVEEQSLDLVLQSIEKNINCPLSSGAGRLFDAVSALLDLCTVSQFHAEAPMRLEAAIENDEKSYSFGIAENPAAHEIRVGSLIEGVLSDMGSGVTPGIISARFHNTIAELIFEMAGRISKETGIMKIALSGGTFQNRYLSERVETKLLDNGFQVLVPKQLPANDGGIAPGQLAIAAKKRSLGLI